MENVTSFVSFIISPGVNMESINCLDLNGSSKEDLEGHLKSEDFFNIKKYPVVTFKITTVNHMTILGILEIKGISKEINFNYTKLDKLKYEAEIIIDRTNFNIKYKSKTIFSDLGDYFIYDEFTIKLTPLVFK